MSSSDSLSGRANKKLRINESSKSSSSSTSLYVVPSKVLHVRNLSVDTQSADLIRWVSTFGAVSYVVMLPKLQQALIEMETLESAARVIQESKTTPIYINGRHVQFNFSKSQEINRSMPVQSPITTTTTTTTTSTPINNSNNSNNNTTHTSVTTSTPSLATTSIVQRHKNEHVLLLTIYNPMFPITVDVLYTILSPYGNVVRIVIFTKNGVQALAEFESPAGAENAKRALDGKDIYDGCCTLKIEFSKIQRLNVRYNNEQTRDYSANLPASPHPSHSSNTPPTPTHVPTNQPLPHHPHEAAHIYQTNHNIAQLLANNAMINPAFIPFYPSPMPLPLQIQNSRSVLILYNLDESRLNCDNLFNLFCLYGNVIKIKLLQNKKGSALVQMEDNFQAEAALTHLNNALVLNKPIQIQYSKHAYIADSKQKSNSSNSPSSENGPSSPSSSEDLPSTKDYSTSPLNRFLRLDANSYKHIYTPTSILHFSNTPPDITEPKFQQLFAQLGAPAPVSVKFFENNSSGSQSNGLPSSPTSSSRGERKNGLLKYNDVQTATEALIFANNTKVNGYTIKLAFSKKQ